ncbi:UNVERIFIED_CONTAM: hypothetical protein NY603_00460 [Bacteroidetes bacterium 56_B9]
MRNYMKEYQRALNERSLYECGSPKWNAVDEKLDYILYDGVKARDDSAVKKVCECIEQLLDLGTDWDDALVQKYVKLLDDNGYSYLNDNTKKVYEIDNESETMKGLLEKTYEKVQQLKQQITEADDWDTENSIRNECQKIEDQIEGMWNFADRVWFYYEASRDNGNDYINIGGVVWDKDVTPLIDSFRKFGVEHFTFSLSWSSAAETARLFEMNGCELEGVVEVNGDFNYETGKYKKMNAYKFAVK